MASVNVTDDTLRYHVLSILSRGNASAGEIAAELYGVDKTGLATDIANRGKVLSTLLTLKAEHRAYPVASGASVTAEQPNSREVSAVANADSKWELTAQGRKTYG